MFVHWDKGEGINNHALEVFTNCTPPGTGLTYAVRGGALGCRQNPEKG